MTLQKLERMHPPPYNEIGGSQHAARRRWSWFRRSHPPSVPSSNVLDPQHAFRGPADIPSYTGRSQTLQMYRSHTNHERALYMERNSLLTKKDLSVKVEQVSIFLTEDNTVICFFENSADDIEHPILKRLESPDTILRRSCDASLLVQAIMDAIIDLALPIVSAYEEVIDQLEIEVLEDPELRHSKLLYILGSELSLLKNTMQPMLGLINALRDHKSGTISMFCQASCSRIALDMLTQTQPRQVSAASLHAYRRPALPLAL
jgi:Mg2+ and Co2+ transporter CorA